MPPLPPLYRDQRKTDQDHLRLLVIFHYIGAALTGAGVLFLAGHFALMRVFFVEADVTRPHPHPLKPEALVVFGWFYGVFAVWLLLTAIGDLISARCIRARRHRGFSLFVAVVNLLHTPLGTILGVFTLVVLVRDSVRELYAAGESGAPAPEPLPPSPPTPAAMPDTPPPLAVPPPVPPAPPPAAEQGDVTGGIIPYKNPHALTAYYLGIFSCFPILGFFLGVTAIFLGVSGLRQRKARPVIRGSVHAWIGIVCGSLSVAAHLAIFAVLILAALRRHH